MSFSGSKLVDRYINVHNIQVHTSYLGDVSKPYGLPYILAQHDSKVHVFHQHESLVLHPYLEQHHRIFNFSENTYNLVYYDKQDDHL